MHLAVLGIFWRFDLSSAYDTGSCTSIGFAIDVLTGPCAFLEQPNVYGQSGVVKPDWNSHGPDCALHFSFQTSSLNKKRSNLVLFTMIGRFKTCLKELADTCRT
uniref:Secreted protein n=1 Tax=Peronospora matthiolae TaxID=2874970 RepID=A0AAV1TXI9_9STRA